jgi:hypothetical protein
MAIEDRIPALTDKELDNLHSNAVRLSANGTAAQKAEATRLMPIIDAAVEDRRIARTADLAERKRARQVTMAETRAKKKASRKAEADAAAETAS